MPPNVGVEWRMGLPSVAKLGLLAAAVAFVAPVASAAVVYDSGGFESTVNFTASNLDGQDPANGPWQKDTGTGTAVVVANNAFSGTRAVQVKRPASASGDTRWAVIKNRTPATGVEVFDVDVDLRVEQ